jgi:hypothetical protein
VAVGTLGVMLLGTVGTLALVADGGDGDGADGDVSAAPAPVTASLSGTLVAQEGSVLAITPVPSTYRITYRVETASGAESVTRTEDITVRRPFDAQLVAYTDATSADDPDIDARSNLGLYGDVTDPDRLDVGYGMPAAALGDLRFDGTIQDLVDSGVFVPRERREVLGRECQVYRTGRLVEAPPLAVPSAATYADVCIDAAGLVLEEVAFVDGIAETYEVATAVEVDGTIGDEAFRIDGTPLTLEEGGNELVPLDLLTAPVEGYWTPAVAPAGTAHVARYLLRAPSPPEGSSDTTTTAGPTNPAAGSVDTYVDVYASGPLFVIVHQGPGDAAPARDTTLGRDVDAGALGAARVGFGATGSMLVAGTEAWFVEVTAPLPATELATIAGSLTSAQ